MTMLQYINIISGGSRSTSGSHTEEEEQPIDPILSLIFSHPENASAPDSSVPLTAEEFESKSSSYLTELSNSRLIFSRSGGASRANNHLFIFPSHHFNSALPKLPEIHDHPRETRCCK